MSSCVARVLASTPYLILRLAQSIHSDTLPKPVNVLQTVYRGPYNSIETLNALHSGVVRPHVYRYATFGQSSVCVEDVEEPVG